MNIKKQVLVIGLLFIVVISIIFFNIRSEYKEQHTITIKELKGLSTITELNSLNNSFKDLRGVSQLNNEKNLFIIDQNKIRLSLEIINDENLIKLYQNILLKQISLSKTELFEQYTQIIKILNEKNRNKIFADYFELEQKLGGKGASEKTAALIIEYSTI